MSSFFQTSKLKYNFFDRIKLPCFLNEPYYSFANLIYRVFQEGDAILTSRAGQRCSKYLYGNTKITDSLKVTDKR